MRRPRLESRGSPREGPACHPAPSAELRKLRRGLLPGGSGRVELDPPWHPWAPRPAGVSSSSSSFFLAELKA
eukprot:5505806-Pyramimonas_sp.AAC.1